MKRNVEKCREIYIYLNKSNQRNCIYSTSGFIWFFEDHNHQECKHNWVTISQNDKSTNTVNWSKLDFHFLDF